MSTISKQQIEERNRQIDEQERKNEETLLNAIHQDRLASLAYGLGYDHACQDFPTKEKSDELLRQEIYRLRDYIELIRETILGIKLVAKTLIATCDRVLMDGNSPETDEYPAQNSEYPRGC